MNSKCPEYLSAVGAVTPDAEKVFPAALINTLPTAGTVLSIDCNKAPVVVKATILNNGPVAVPKFTCMSAEKLLMSIFPAIT
jgi:hypothetical protein